MLFKTITIALCIVLGVEIQNSAAEESCPIIPRPLAAEKSIGFFEIQQHTQIVGIKNTATYISFFKQQLKSKTGLEIIAAKTAKNKIVLTLSNKIEVSGSYQLKVTPQMIEIKAADEDGLFNGLVSLLQLATFAKINHPTIQIPTWSINDAPKFAWRGLMLDEARHFFGMNKVKQLLDWMAFYKLNRFHWHLTDSQGWRIAINKYPALALIGGKGDFTDSLKAPNYYTQQQISEIVAYAQQRNITVIPEIDMPGHATAANKAYPIFNGGGSAEYPNFTFNPGKEETYGYLTQILRETIQLFPSKMIHLGGDEVEFGAKAWNDNTAVKVLMQSKNLNNINEVEHYFFNRMADSVKKLGSKVLAWDEAVDANLDPQNTLIFWWRQDKKNQLQKAIDKGFPVILCPRLPMYFDFVQDEQHKIGRKWKEKFNSLQNVYEFPSGDPLYQNALVQGVQANLWTETITNTYRFDFMIFPRIAALAEATWTADRNKNFSAFEGNLKNHLQLYKKQNINYYDPFERTIREN